MSTIPWTHEGSSSLRCSGDESSGNSGVGGRSKAPLQHFFLVFLHTCSQRVPATDKGKGGKKTGSPLPVDD